MTNPHPSAGNGTTRRYLPHIDGLRAIAIIPVVLFHLSPSFCPGGFTGVDVFFVISGYLITGGIVGEINAGCFSLSDFYVRRIKRILPAYFTIIAVVLIVSALLFSLNYFQTIAAAATYSALFSANVYFWQVVNYFGLSARENPLLHLWSLGVEEQFYLFVPLLIFFAWKFQKKYVWRSLALLSLISLGISCLALQQRRVEFAFFMLPSRAWELFAGALLALWSSQQSQARGQTVHAWIGLILVLLPFVIYSEKTVFPGIAAVPSVFGAAMLIRAGASGIPGALLSSPPAVFVGKISYSLYLWHWPMAVFLGAGVSAKRTFATLVASFLGAYLSWRFVEVPTRSIRAFPPLRAFSLLAGGSVAIVAACLWVGKLESGIGEVPSNWRGVPTWRTLENVHDSRRSECSLDDLTEGKNGVLIPAGDSYVPPTFALWGDSHALSVLPGVDEVAKKWKRAGLFINLKHSLTLQAEIGGYPFNPRNDRAPVLQWLESRPDIVDVFLVNYWFVHLKSDADVAEVVGICQRLRSAGKRVFFFRNVPVLKTSRVLWRLSWGLQTDRTLLQMELAEYEANAVLQNRLLSVLAAEKLATLIPFDQAFKDGDAYYVGTKASSYFADNSHVNRNGAIKGMEYVAPLLWGPVSQH